MPSWNLVIYLTTSCIRHVSSKFLRNALSWEQRWTEFASNLRGFAPGSSSTKDNNNILLWHISNTHAQTQYRLTSAGKSILWRCQQRVSDHLLCSVQQIAKWVQVTDGQNRFLTLIDLFVGWISFHHVTCTTLSGSWITMRPHKS